MFNIFKKPTLQEYLAARLGPIEHDPDGELFGVKLPYNFKRMEFGTIKKFGHCTKELAESSHKWWTQHFTEEFAARRGR
ncbi:MAG: hypothetical protein LBH81_02565 [Rickettsiales bacterium]|jgi:hypothetical protein|nr:hypothetical protein [Rickettsiales bacterium]